MKNVQLKFKSNFLLAYPTSCCSSTLQLKILIRLPISNTLSSGPRCLILLSSYQIRTRRLGFLLQLANMRIRTIPDRIKINYQSLIECDPHLSTHYNRWIQITLDRRRRNQTLLLKVALSRPINSNKSVNILGLAVSDARKEILLSSKISLKTKSLNTWKKRRKTIEGETLLQTVWSCAHYKTLG